MTLDELLAEANLAQAPTLIGISKVSPGGVDPLGLRQINFDLMDRVLPGLNNVAGRLRPFILMSWAWRRVRVIIDRDGLTGATDEQMRDFVDRIEAIYTWSQYLIDPEPGIPGGQTLRPLIAGDLSTYRFGGDEWVNRRNLRRTSTGLISPLNYGPGLRSMGWLIPTDVLGVFQANDDLEPALEAFEASFSTELDHEVFNRFGDVSVDRADVKRWADLWALGAQTSAEILAGKAHLFGSAANELRQAGFALVQTAVELSEDSDPDPNDVRAIMASDASDVPSNLRPTALAWRRVQTRQLFRLALEGLFYWIIRELDEAPRSSAWLAKEFVEQVGNLEKASAEEWFAGNVGDNPVALLDQLAGSLNEQEESGLAQAIRDALGFSIAESRGDDDGDWPHDRLPMKRAVAEFEQWKSLEPVHCVEKMIEVWVLAQHAYWCVGRGLADARSRGKTLLRLRVVMDEGGWTLTPGTRAGNPPLPTPDRLATALSLLRETRQI